MQIDVQEREEQLRQRIAGAIQRRRKDLNWTQQTLAEQMNRASKAGPRWNQSMVAKLESTTEPAPHRLEQLDVVAAAMGLHPLELILPVYTEADVAVIREATRELYATDVWRDALGRQQRLVELVRNPGVRRLLEALLELDDRERVTVVEMVVALGDRRKPRGPQRTSLGPERRN